ncbi:hypothetical protein D3C76_1685090 [compost metagenome]
MSQTRTNIAPSTAVWGSVSRKLSPLYSVTMLGTTRPKNGMVPTVIMTTAETMATRINPRFTTLRYARPRLVAKSSPIPASVKRLAKR